MHRAYADIADARGDWQIHYRECGTGAPLILLHPSPLSSESLAPQMELLSADFRCIALDTPGYGYSDPLPTPTTEDSSLQPYVAALTAFMDAIAVDRPLIYGSATGAQIAIEFARQHPERCAGLLLENTALFGEEEAASVLEGYFPSINAQEDGSHLQLLWKMSARSTRYFPWYADGPHAERRSAYPPAAIVDSVVRDYLNAGESYDRAYRAAFANERPAPLQALEVPTHIILWDDGLLGEYGERVKELKLPDCVSIQRASSGMDARMRALSESALQLHPSFVNPNEAER